MQSSLVKAATGVYRYTKPVCQEETCISCKNLSDCQDAIRHIQGLFRKRTRGELTHDALVAGNKARFGNPTVYHIRKHWREILRDDIQWFKPLVKQLTDATNEERANVRNKIINGPTGAEYIALVEELAQNQWYWMRIGDDNKLVFRTNIPFVYAGYRRDAKPVTTADPDFIPEEEPEMDELTQEELTFG